jgi:hypothetical protein
MTGAYVDVCRTLGLRDHDQPEADAIAKTVIEFAQRGARDRVRLRDCVLQALQASPNEWARQRAAKLNGSKPLRS